MSKKRIGEKKLRLQFDLSQEQVNYLDDIVKRTGSASRAETIRKAIWFLGWATNKVRNRGESVELPATLVELICNVWPVAKEEVP